MNVGLIVVEALSVGENVVLMTDIDLATLVA